MTLIGRRGRTVTVVLSNCRQLNS